MAHLNLTATLIDRLQPGPSDVLYRDANISGFGLKVTALGAKSFFVEARIKGGGRTRRKVIGRYPRIGVDEARTQALNYLALFNAGQDPIAEARTVRQTTTSRRSSERWTTTWRRKGSSPVRKRGTAGS